MFGERGDKIQKFTLRKINKRYSFLSNPVLALAFLLDPFFDNLRKAMDVLGILIISVIIIIIIIFVIQYRHRDHNYYRDDGRYHHNYCHYYFSHLILTSRCFDRNESALGSS